MNIINKNPIEKLGYGFVSPEHIPAGEDEYYLRNIQNRSGISYRNLNDDEINQLKRNGNSSDNWKNVLVSDQFNPELIQRCKFYGLVRIGKQENCFFEFNNLSLPIGIYNSTIISCDIGDNVAIENVNYMSHYIVGNSVMLVNINELATTNYAKFGNGILKTGEKESIRIWIEVCNENAGRNILPFNGMLPGDAWLWSKYRDNDLLLKQFKSFTEKRFDAQRGYYGKIGDCTVIKNCRIIKDVWVGAHAYIKGANKLKNLTINSSDIAKSQIGEGCELVNGIIGFGCRIFYGVKAVRFIMGANSQLKYGARLINSYLSDNSTISCCEVLNSLIFPGHEQHHNNSFLCAAVVMGQSNMAAGATIGSNHNSRSADGEIIAGRGFWPGLCVSLKHNSKFASFTLLAKGDFPAELNIPIPFSLVNNDVSKDELIVMPGYWFMYNMYALARNAGKCASRDKRIDKIQTLEYDYLAPDSINEMFSSLLLIEKAVAKAWALKNKKKITTDSALQKKGKELLLSKATSINKLEVIGEGFENSSRKVKIIKPVEAYFIFKKFIQFYCCTQLINFYTQQKKSSFEKFVSALSSKQTRENWINVGGQLMPTSYVDKLVKSICSNKISSWDEVHDFYADATTTYPKAKAMHAFAALLEILEIPLQKFNKKTFATLLNNAVETRQLISSNIYSSREKDYENDFRKMVYANDQEMEQVIGSLADNAFIKQEEKELAKFKEDVAMLKEKLAL